MKTLIYKASHVLWGGYYAERKEDGIVTQCHSPLTPVKGGQRYKDVSPMLIDSIAEVSP